jgi:hypothetical protein
MCGLGNQMYQYAFGMALKKSGGGRVLFDASEFGCAGETRRYELHNFNARVEFATPKQIAAARKSPPVARLLRHLFGIKKRRVFRERDFNLYNAELLSGSEYSYFYGFFQSYKYFEALRGDLSRDFQLRVPPDGRNKEMLDKIHETNSVFVHIRRGDFLQHRNLFKILSPDYYNRAIEYMRGHVKNPLFFVFGQDLDWARKNLKFGNSAIFVDINGEDAGFLDLELMKRCKHGITANSTFSWWAAWLNENSAKIVVTPRRWFNNHSNGDELPEEWVKL